MNKYDIIIAGAGISGTVCGKLLAESGLKCLILEAADGPFEKVCGGWIPYKAVALLKQLGFDTDYLLKTGRKTNGVIIEKDGKAQTYSYKCDEYGIGTYRIELHKLLADAACRCGCVINYSERVKTVERQDDYYIVNGFAAGNFISAVGAIPFCNGTDMTYNGQTFGISEIISAETILKHDYVYFFYPDNSKNYFWIIPIAKNTWNVGWWSDNPFNLKNDFINNRKKYINKYFNDAKVIRSAKGGVCGSRDNSCTLPQGSFSLGDFAGLNCSDSGEGIYAAVLSAYKLAEYMRK